jgi:phosphotriesterase-related protein
MQRRAFLRGAVGALISSSTPAQDASGPSILTHEHILVDFIGADAISRDRYRLQDAFDAALPKLREVKALGCQRLLECTPNYIGRDPRLCRMLSEAVGMEILDEYRTLRGGQPPLSAGLCQDGKRGPTGEALDSGVAGRSRRTTPRFIKIGVNKGPLHAWDRKIVEAAAITSAETGLPIAAHTGDGTAALEELEIITKQDVPASRFVWVHAQSELEHRIHHEVARAGAWVSFDGISSSSVRWHERCVESIARAGLLHQTLISHDAGWYRPGETGGGDYRGYADVYRIFEPSVPDWFETLLWTNPRRAFGD